MSQAGPVDLEAEYDNRARVPEHPAIIAGWERDAAAYRAARGARTEFGLRYGEHSRHVIDLFYPDAPDVQQPLVVLIHGGYWRSLHPSLFSHLAAGANARGIAVALPGYRLCPEVAIIDIIADLRGACAFLYRRQPRPMVVCGHSAGGHLAACMLATDWTAEGPDLPPALVRHGLAVSGIFDLTPLLQTSVNDTLHLNATTARAASPAFWPAPAGAAFELWVGEAEASEYFRQSESIAALWAAEGVDTSVHVARGGNHFTAPEPLADPESEMTEHLAALCAAARHP